MRSWVEHRQGQAVSAGSDAPTHEGPGAGQATRIRGVVDALRRLDHGAGASRETEQVIATALEAGLTPDGIAALLAGSVERPGRYTDAAPARRRAAA